MNTRRNEDVVDGVLNDMERHARRARLAIGAAVAVEGLLIVVALLKMNFSDNTQVLFFILSLLGYTIVALGLAALGAHVSRVGARIVAALDDRGPST